MLTNLYNKKGIFFNFIIFFRYIFYNSLSVYLLNYLTFLSPSSKSFPLSLSLFHILLSPPSSFPLSFSDSSFFSPIYQEPYFLITVHEILITARLGGIPQCVIFNPSSSARNMKYSPTQKNYPQHQLNTQSYAIPLLFFSFAR